MRSAVQMEIRRKGGGVENPFQMECGSSSVNINHCNLHHIWPISIMISIRIPSKNTFLFRSFRWSRRFWKAYPSEPSECFGFFWRILIAWNGRYPMMMVWWGANLLVQTVEQMPYPRQVPCSHPQTKGSKPKPKPNPKPQNNLSTSPTFFGLSSINIFTQRRGRMWCFDQRLASWGKVLLFILTGSCCWAFRQLGKECER